MKAKISTQITLYFFFFVFNCALQSLVTAQLLFLRGTKDRTISTNPQPTTPVNYF